MKLIEKYNCTLPWMDPLEFPNAKECEVDTIPHTEPGNHSFDYVGIWEIVRDWNQFYAGAQEYEDILPCNRTVFYSVNERQPSKTEDTYAKVTINYVNPYIQVIKDSSSYDMQSLIGEVGGTLGLLLGFSFISIFDLFEGVFKSLFKQK